LFPSSASVLKSSVCFFGLSVAFVNGNAESVTYNMAVVRRRLGTFTGDVFTEILFLQGGFPWRLWSTCSCMRASVLGSPLWDYCLLARACRWCDWCLFPVKVGFAWGIQQLNSTVCYWWASKIKTCCRIENRPEDSFWIFFIVGDGGVPDYGSDGRRWRRALDAI
jgi:hypothetical protein